MIITFVFLVVGGVLFKVYIVGEAIKVVRRFSLPDVSKCELSKNAGVYHFPRVSCAAASADEADLDPHVGGKLILFEHIDFCIRIALERLAYTVDIKHSIFFRVEIVVICGLCCGPKSVIGARSSTLVDSHFFSMSLFLQSFLHDHYSRDWQGSYGDGWYTFYLL